MKKILGLQAPMELNQTGVEYKKIHACPNDLYCADMILKKCIKASDVGYHDTK